MDDLTRCVLTPAVPTEGFDPLGVGVHRGSTIVFKDAEAYATRGQRGDEGYSYGLYGTPTTRTLEAKLTELEQGVRTFLTPSGQTSNALAVLPFLSAGDRILLADTVYPPMRDFAENDLKRYGIDVAYYDPVSPDALASMVDDRTRMVWCETPGSTTMEVQDLPRIAAIARAAGALVGCDNTWATPLNYKPLVLGADIVTEALTKYVSGHSDVLMGSITVADAALAGPLKGFMGRSGIGVSPDDASLVLRGFETLGVRMKHAFDVALELMQWIADLPVVERVLHPALPSSPGHAVWMRDAAGSSAVFSVVLRPEFVRHVPAAMDCLMVFAIGASWGGTRSLIAPMPVRAHRTATRWQGDDLVLRFSIGLESVADLRADLETFFRALDAPVDNR